MRHVRVAAISVDSVDKSKSLAQDLGLSFPLLSDPDMKVIRAYGVADEGNGIAWPAEFLLGRDGHVLWRATAQSVSVRPSTSDVLRAMDAANAGAAGAK